MKKIILPPNFDENIKEFYQESFECIYIIFHPFIIFPDNFDLDKLFEEEKNLTRRSTKIVENGKKLSWQEFLSLSNVKNYNTLNKVLLSIIGAYGFDDKFKKYSLTVKKDVEQKLNILFPTEGIFPYILNRLFIDSLRVFGYSTAYLSDEFGDDIELIDLNNDLAIVNCNIHERSLFTDDAKIAYTVHFDNFFTMLCSDKEIVDKIVNKYQFEGFYCDENTTVYWHNDMDI